MDNTAMTCTILCTKTYTRMNEQFIFEFRSRLWNSDTLGFTVLNIASHSNRHTEGVEFLHVRHYNS